MRISNKKLFIDLKYFSSECHTRALNCEGMVDEFWKNDIYSNHGLPVGIRIPTVRRAIFRQLQNQKLFMLGSISKYGVRAAYLQRKPERCTSVLTRRKTKDLSHGHSWKDLPQHAGPRQSDKKLAHLRRLCSNTHSESPTTLCQRFIWHRARTYYLRAGCHDNRPLPISLPVGGIPQAQGSCEAAYASRFAWQHSDGSFYYQRENSRSQHPRQPIHRSRRNLYYGSWLSELRSSIQHQSISSIFCNTSQKQLQLSTTLFTKDRQSNGTQMRSGHYSAWLLLQKRLSGETQANSLLRRERKKETCFPDQQLWQIELFFKWIKQHLRIKAFYGTSENAVKTQIWIAITIYVLVAIIKKQLKLEQSLYTILQIESVTLFEKMPLLQALTDIETIEQEVLINNQLNLFS